MKFDLEQARMQIVREENLGVYQQFLKRADKIKHEFEELRKDMLRYEHRMPSESVDVVHVGLCTKVISLKALLKEK